MPNAEETDVLVVGAGPAGLIAAREAASRGVEVVVVEEHREIGLPARCSGLLSVGGLREIGVSPGRRFVQNEVLGANFHSPGGLSFTVEGAEKKAYVVDRAVFDKTLAGQAARAGADLKLAFQAKSFLKQGGFVSGVVGKKDENLTARVIIDAEGYSCRLLKKAGFRTPDPEGRLPAVQFEVVGVKVDPDYVDIFVGSKVAPGFFAWIIPTGTDSAKIGLASKDASPYTLLQNLVKEKVGRCQIVAIQTGCVTTSGPAPRTYGDGVIVVGDAAGQTKATTGGGVITGGICAKFAGEVAAEAVSQNDVSAKSLRMYEKKWKKRLGRELSTMRLARRIANRLSDDTIDEAFRTVIEKELHRVIEDEADIDFQSGVLRRLARHPSVLKILVNVARDLL